jgi:hypothetical protein
MEFYLIAYDQKCAYCFAKQWRGSSLPVLDDVKIGRHERDQIKMATPIKKHASTQAVKIITETELFCGLGVIICYAITYLCS